MQEFRLILPSNTFKISFEVDGKEQYAIFKRLKIDEIKDLRDKLRKYQKLKDASEDDVNLVEAKDASLDVLRMVFVEGYPIESMMDFPVASVGMILDKVMEEQSLGDAKKKK